MPSSQAVQDEWHVALAIGAAGNARLHLVREGVERPISCLEGRPRPKAQGIVDKLTNLSENKGHDRHFGMDECKAMGLKIEAIEDDDTFQDLVLTIHHCYMHTLTNAPTIKITENQMGKAVVRQQQLMAVPGFAPQP